ncbi:MAG: hypothetical protein J5951_00050, partial [Bacteroidales bacterium]|nr:hypothetical protein [Bacteroidales bacterium]
RYAAFWDALLGEVGSRTPAGPDEAQARARELLGDGYEAAVADARIDATLRRAYEVFGRTSTQEKSGVPRLVCGQRWLVPEVDDAEALLQLIRTEFGLPVVSE